MASSTCVTNPLLRGPHCHRIIILLIQRPDGLLEVLRSQVGVALRHPSIPVAQELLHDIQINATLYQIRSKGMPEIVEGEIGYSAFVADLYKPLVNHIWSQGTGADVMKRIAASMVGDMITMTIFKLLVVPVIYSLWQGWQQHREER